MSTTNQLPTFGPSDYENAIEGNFNSFLKSVGIPLPVLAALSLTLFTGLGQAKVFGLDMNNEIGARVLGITLIVLSIFITRCLKNMTYIFGWLEDDHRNRIESTKTGENKLPESTHDLLIPIKLKVRTNPNLFNFLMLSAYGDDIHNSRYLGTWSLSLLYGISHAVIMVLLFTQGFGLFQSGQPSSVSLWTRIIDVLLLCAIGYYYGFFVASANFALIKFVGEHEAKVRVRIFGIGAAIPLLFFIINLFFVPVVP